MPFFQDADGITLIVITVGGCVHAVFALIGAVTDGIHAVGGGMNHEVLSNMPLRVL